MNIYKKNSRIIFVCVISITIGCFLIFGWNLVFDCLLSLKCNVMLYNYWKNLPLDIPTEFYLFNWTNPEDVYNKSVKPKIEEIGPYTFLQREEKNNIVWNDNGTVTFQQRRFWYYDESKSIGSLEDNITNVNPTIMGVSYVSRHWNYLFKKSIFISLSSFFNTVYDSHKVSDILFDGYPAPLMKLASSLPIFADLKLPSWDRFGWMYNRNGSSEFDGVFNMGTGSNTVLGEIFNWNYQQNTGYFETTCGKIHGSAGQFFPRNLDKEYLEVFSTDLRRTVTFRYVGDKKVKNILGRKYVAGRYLLDNGTLIPKNKCFCTGECVPTGVTNISSTRHNGPLFASLPHFYGADPYYVTLVEGLNPDEKKHEVSFIVEPTTGIILEADAKVQINIMMQPISGSSLLENAPRIFFPVIWIRQKATIPDKQCLLLKLVLVFPIVCVILGGILCICSILLLFYKVYKWKTSQEKNRNGKAVEDLLLKHRIHT